MADPAVKMKFFGDEKDAERAIVALERKYDKLENKIKQTNRSSRKGSKSAADGVKKWAGSMAGIVSSYVALPGLILAALNQQKNLRREAEMTAVAMEKSAKKLQIQAGLSDVKSKEVQQRISELAKKTGVPQRIINRIATEQVSQGFADPVSGGATESFISFLQSSNVDVEQADIEGQVGGAAQFLTGRGKRLTNKNLLDLLVRTRGLFKGTPIQAADLPAFAAPGAVAKNLGIGDEDFLSAAAILRGTQKAPEAATGLTKFLNVLSGKQSKVTKTLQGAGINPEDVDFVGESLPEVIKTIGDAFKKLDEKERTPFLQKIFGAEKTNLLAAQSLIQGVEQGKFKEFAKFQSDVAGFEAGVRVARRGIGPAGNKLDAAIKQEEVRLVEGGDTPNKLLGQAIELRRKRSMREFREQPDFVQGFLEIPVQMGMLFEQAITAISPELSATREDREVARKAMEDNNFALKELTKAINDQNANANAPINRNAQGE